MLSDAAGHSIRRELVEFIRDLDVDESTALVALAWIGGGDFEPDERKSAVAEARSRAPFFWLASEARVSSRRRSFPEGGWRVQRTGPNVACASSGQQVSGALALLIGHQYSTLSSVE
jgi:hypothetical protein